MPNIINESIVHALTKVIEWKEIETYRSKVSIQSGNALIKNSIVCSGDPLL